MTSGIFVISSDMPAWMRAYLASEGIPCEFKLEELSESQKSALDFALRLAELEEKGLVKIIFDPKKHKCPYVCLTDKGTKVAEKLVEKNKRYKVSEVKCKTCGKPLREGKIITFVQGKILGTRIVIECSKCGRLHRFQIKETHEK